jgi:hypothetical protein
MEHTMQTTPQTTTSSPLADLIHMDAYRAQRTSHVMDRATLALLNTALTELEAALPQWSWSLAAATCQLQGRRLNAANNLATLIVLTPPMPVSGCWQALVHQERTSQLGAIDAAFEPSPLAAITEALLLVAAR